MKISLYKKLGMVVTMLITFLSASAYDFEVDGIYYNVVSFTEFTCAVTSGENEYTGEIVIPAEVVYNNRTLKIVSIGIAFKGNKYLTSVVIPNSVTSIGEGAFRDCSSLTSVAIPNSVTSIGDYAFYGCSSLTSVEMNSVTEIGDYAFWNCSSLTTVEMNSVTSIGDYAFSGCRFLTMVEMNSVISIGNCAFVGCSSLTSVEIPNSVTEIGNRAFRGCSKLKNIVLSDNLKAIKYGTFENCKSLSNLTIPGSVERIEQQYYEWIYSKYEYYWTGSAPINQISFLYGENTLKSGHYDGIYGFSGSFWSSSWTDELEKVFFDRQMEASMYLRKLKELTIGEHLAELKIEKISDCKDLELIISYAMTPPSSPKFSNAQYLNLNVIVPDEALAAYQADAVWGNFWNLQSFSASGVDGVEVEPAERTVVGRYDLNGRAVTEDYKGISIVRFSDGSTKKLVQ